MCAPTNRLNVLKRLVPIALEALGSIQAGQVVKVR